MDKTKQREVTDMQNSNETPAAATVTKREAKDRNQLLEILDIISDGDLEERPTSFQVIGVHSQMARETARKEQQQRLVEVDNFMNELKTEIDDSEHDQLQSENPLQKSFTLNMDAEMHQRRSTSLAVNLPTLDLGAVAAQLAKKQLKMSIFSPIVQNVDISPTSKKKNVEMVLKDAVSIELEMSCDELHLAEVNTPARVFGRERAFSFQEQRSRAPIQFEKLDIASNSEESESADDADVVEPHLSDRSLGYQTGCLGSQQQRDPRTGGAENAQAGRRSMGMLQTLKAELMREESSPSEPKDDRKEDQEASMKMKKKNLERLKRNLRKKRLEKEDRLKLTLKARKVQFFSKDYIQRSRNIKANDDVLVLLHSLKPPDEPGNGNLHG